MKRIGTHDWWHYSAPKPKPIPRGIIDFDTAGFPTPRLVVKPDHQEHFFTFGTWKPFTLRVFNKNGDVERDCTRFATPICTGKECYTLIVGLVVHRMFQEQVTHRKWVSFQRIGYNIDTRYNLIPGGDVAPASWTMLNGLAHDVEWTPYDEFKTIQEIRPR